MIGAGESADVSAVKRHILAVVVLYRMAPEESPAFSSLRSLLEQHPWIAAEFVCVLYDNSPAPHLVPDTAFPCLYLHDQSNPGLARPYQYAMDHALQQDIPWLLLLDQDTVITAEYLEEALAVTKNVEPDRKIMAVVPKLLRGSDVLSPGWPHRHPNPEPLGNRSGLLEQKVRIFNSGSILRVAALKEIGGFPQSYPLDYLDHATFYRLQEKGGRAYLMRAGLQHDLSSLHLDPVRDFRTSHRARLTANAEGRYYLQYGTPRELCLYVLRRSRLGLCMILAGHFRGALMLLRCTIFPS
jgi:GT2 family glycosyltransferase